jgi:hypothetical protein
MCSVEPSERGGYFERWWPERRSSFTNGNRLGRFAARAVYLDFIQKMSRKARELVRLADLKRI